MTSGLLKIKRDEDALKLTNFYVDEMLLEGNRLRSLSCTKNKFQTTFEMKGSGEARVFLALENLRDHRSRA